MDAAKRRKVLQDRYLKDPHFKKAWEDGGGAVIEVKAKRRRIAWPA